MSEHEMMTYEKEMTVKVLELSPLGYGNSESKIRYERDTDPEVMGAMKEATAEFIKSGKGLVDITEKDDGCIDGRTAMSITYVDQTGASRTVEVAFDVEETGHERYKVAGGGYITALAMELAVHPPAGGVETVLRGVATSLAERGIYCGGHTGEHEDAEACTTDCGARDKEEPILETSLIYKDDVSQSTRQVCETAGRTYSEQAQSTVYENWAYVLNNESFFEDSTGYSQAEAIFDFIKEAQSAAGQERPLAVSKKLRGDHNERFIVANFVESKTFSQKLLRDHLRKLFPDVNDSEYPQVFVVDAPRIIELARALYSDETDQQIAVQAGVTYQFGTAATLTDGSLRVMAIVNS
jgi:hypothetical protein